MKNKQKHLSSKSKWHLEEAKIGGALFGKIDDGTKREFFCLDERTWIWHEEWQTSNGLIHTRTTRYDVLKDKIIKSQDGADPQTATIHETERLLHAAKEYQARVDNKLYNGN